MRANEFIIESLKQPHDQGVVEAFDQPYKGKWEKSESDSHDMLVRLPDGTNLSIMFNNEGNDEYQVEFYRNNSQELTGEGDAQRIFATVLNAIQKFVKKRQPWRLIFSASKSVEPGQNPQSRARLYDRLVGRYANDWGYESYSEDHGDQITYEITKKKQGVAENLDNIPIIGINVRDDGDIHYADLIVDGKKKYESRRTNSLNPYIGKTVGIIRTGNRPAVAIGQATIGEPIIVDADKFDKLRNQHLVPKNSKFDIDIDGTKYLYPMINPIRWDVEKPIKHKGIVSRKIQEQGVAEGKITLSTDPNWYGAEVGDYKSTEPVVSIPISKLVGFEPDDKMNQPDSKANVKKIVAGLKQGAKLPPILVRKYKNGYQVLDGHHRFWAYKLLGVKSIPSRIVPDSDIEEIGKQGVAEGLQVDVPETVNPNVFQPTFHQEQKHGAYTLVAQPGRLLLHQKSTEPSEQFRIEAKYRGHTVAWVNFENIDGHLEALDLSVDAKHRRKGIATAMYQFAKQLGNDIEPSRKQTAMGRQFWAVKSPVRDMAGGLQVGSPNIPV